MSHRPTKAHLNLSQLTTICNCYRNPCSTTVWTDLFNSTNNIHTRNNLSKDNMFVIQPWSFSSTQKELWPICIWSTVCHRQDSRSCMFQLKIFIVKFWAIDWFSAYAHCKWYAIEYEVRAMPGKTRYIFCSYQRMILPVPLCLVKSPPWLVYIMYEVSGEYDENKI